MGLTVISIKAIETIPFIYFALFWITQMALYSVSENPFNHHLCPAVHPPNQLLVQWTWGLLGHRDLKKMNLKHPRVFNDHTESV